MPNVLNVKNVPMEADSVIEVYNNYALFGTIQVAETYKCVEFAQLILS